ncbi:MAG TPA: hypothetical protein PLB52_00530 [Candidatus Moranbacteria bacterium]|nr:hypothetical protein [Candidatus Moranbacteria bacterium]
MKKTLQELFDEAETLNRRMIEKLMQIILFSELRNILPAIDKKISKCQEQIELENDRKKLQAKMLKIKKRFADKLRRPELVKMKGFIFLNFVSVNYCLIGNKVKRRFNKIIPADKITIKMIRGADNKVVKRQVKKLKPANKSAKRKKSRKKEKNLDFSPNTATLAINARQTAGWPMVDVVSDRRLFRKRSLSTLR